MPVERQEYTATSIWAYAIPKTIHPSSGAQPGNLNVVISDHETYTVTIATIAFEFYLLA